MSTGGKIGENFQAINELWNGASWTEVGDLNTARGYLCNIGTTTAAVAAGGSSPYTAVSEEFNGTAWTEGNNLNEVKSYLESGFGIQTAALVAGGYNPTSPTYKVSTEEYDGTSWTEVGNIPTATAGAAGGAGTTTAGIYAGGQTPSATNATYEWTGPAAAAVTFTSS